MQDCDSAFLTTTVHSAQRAAEEDFLSMRDLGKLQEVANHLRERLVSGSHPALEERSMIGESVSAGGSNGN